MTTNAYKRLHQQWNGATEETRIAEDQLHNAWNAFAAGKSGPPSEEFLNDVARLRKAERERLSQLLESFIADRDGQTPDGGA